MAPAAERDVGGHHRQAPGVDGPHHRDAAEGVSHSPAGGRGSGGRGWGRGCGERDCRRALLRAVPRSRAGAVPPGVLRGGGAVGGAEAVSTSAGRVRGERAVRQESEGRQLVGGERAGRAGHGPGDARGPIASVRGRVDIIQSGPERGGKKRWNKLNNY